MRIALSGTELAEGEGIETLVDAASAVGVDAVEVWYPRNTGADVRSVLTRLTSAGIVAVCLSSGIELLRDAGSEHEQQKLLDLVRLAADYGIPLVNTYFGFCSARDDARAIDRYLHWAAPCIALAEKRGVIISIENEFNAFGWDPSASDATRRPDALRRLLAQADSPHFRTTFDPANFVCAGVEDVLRAYRAVAPFIAYVHVKDVVGLPANNAPDADDSEWRVYSDFDRYYRTCPLTEGLVPWPSLLGELASDGYDGVLTLEPHSQPPIRAAAWTQAASRLSALVEQARAERSGVR